MQHRVHALTPREDHFVFLWVVRETVFKGEVEGKGRDSLGFLCFPGQELFEELEAVFLFGGSFLESSKIPIFEQFALEVLAEGVEFLFGEDPRVWCCFGPIDGAMGGFFDHRAKELHEVT